jgi:hypothetical protein
VPIDQVSLLLGHSSVKITERHYAPFVKARQEQLAQSARKAWHFETCAKPEMQERKGPRTRKGEEQQKHQSASDGPRSGPDAQTSVHV